jgi:tetratricopeptide (TPR) repeat protein
VQENEIAHYCQKCLAANPLGQDFCSRCGTRLMIVVEPASMRFESGESGQSAEEHFLERISVLENRLGRMTDRLERTLDLLLRHAQNSYFDRSLLKTLIAVLNEGGVIDGAKLERLWQQRCDEDTAAQEQSARRQGMRSKIAAAYRGVDRVAFERLIDDGFLLVDDGAIDRGIRSLQRAVDMDSHNALLLSFLGEHFFRTGRLKLARGYLAKAQEVAPDDNHVLLLLGLVYGDEGQTARARDLLQTATRRGGPCFAAHYALGRLFLAEDDWPKALREFKRALAAKPSPEAHYALACVYYQLSRDGLAARHLLKALVLDAGYLEASYLLGVVYQRGGHDELARSAFDNAKIESGAKHDGQELPAKDDGKTSATPFMTRIGKSKRLVTGGDMRLANALREDAIKAFVATNSGSR